MRTKSGYYLLIFAHTIASSAMAGVTLDGSLGAQGALTGPNYNIGAELGKTVGSNLFHSFGIFNIASGESASFSGPSNISSIIGRVTGGSASSIDGLIRSTVPDANLFLINPAGMVFGSNASLDVGGSFHAGSASHIRMTDGSLFHADLSTNSTFSAAPPAAFGFLSPAAVRLDGAHLVVPRGKEITLAGGDISLQQSTLWAPAGRITLISAASEGEALLGDASTSFSQGGQIALSAGSALYSTGDEVMTGGGKIVIRGGNLALDASSIEGVSVDQEGQGIDIKIQNDITLSSISEITTSTTGAGNSGAISLVAGGTISVSGNTASSWTAIRSNTSGSGNAGKISLGASQVVVDGGVIQSLSEGQGASGQSGAIEIQTGNLTLLRGGQLDSGTREGTTGNGGGIFIQASEAVTVTGKNQDGYPSLINVSSRGAGTGGNAFIKAPSVNVLGEGSIYAFSFSQGDAGQIQIETDKLTVQGGGNITTSAFGSGKGGDVLINSTGSVLLSGRNQDDYSAIEANTHGSGRGGFISIKSPSITLDQGAEIRASTSNGGQGGHIELISGRIELLSSSAIEIDSSGSGDGGRIQIQSESLLIRDGASIQAKASSSGKGGNIQLDTNTFTILGGGQVSASTTGAGHGGVISVTATDSILISGQDEQGAYSAVRANTSNSGGGGSISLAAPKIKIEDNSLISASASDTGSAGYIQIDAGNLDVLGGAHISASTNSAGAGGDIKITASGAVTVGGEWVDGIPSAILAQTFGAGNAGSITINAASLAILDGGKINSSSRHNQGGNGGNVQIAARDSVVIAGETLAGGASGIFADTTGQGAGGNIEIKAPDILISESGTIQASTYASGAGGSITLEAKRVNILNGGEIISDTTGSGKGGSIDIKSSESIQLSGRSKWDYRSLVRANSGNIGDGGIITLVAPEILMNDAAVQVSSYGELSSGLLNGSAGAVKIQAERLTMENGATIDSSSLFSSTGNGGLISIQATSGISLSGRSSSIKALTEGPGNGGYIHLLAPEITLDDGAQIKAETSGSGAGGYIKIEGDTLNFLGGSAVEANTEGSGNGGAISITANRSFHLASTADATTPSGIRASTYGSGNGGLIKLKSPTILMDHGLVQARTHGSLPGGAANGAAGNITIETGQISLVNGAQIDTSSRGGSNGKGGGILIEARDSITVTGYAPSYPTAIFSNTFGSGDGGYIYLIAPELIVGNHALIQAATKGKGAGGSIRIEAEKISIAGEATISAATYGTGRGGYINLVSSTIEMDDGYVQALTSGMLAWGEANGDAGNIAIETGKLSLSNGAQIDTGSRGDSNGKGGGIFIDAKDSISVAGKGSKFPSAIFSNTFGVGDGGYIFLVTPRLSVSNNAYIQAATTNNGAGGYINIEADTISVTNDGIISAATFGSGNGGFINILAKESVSLSGGGSISAQTEGLGNGGAVFIESASIDMNGGKISTDSKGSGTGGYIHILAGKNLTMTNRSSIESRSSNAGDAGSIFIDTDIFTADNSLLTTAASHASGGNIELLATTVRLQNHSAITATVGGGFGDGGNVTITAQGLAAVENSDFTARANQGHGGRITINAEAFLRATDVDLDASSDVLGNEGIVEINAPYLDLSGSLVVLPPQFLDASALLNDPCAALRASGESSFVVKGKGGLPFQPDNLFPGSLMMKPPMQVNAKRAAGSRLPLSTDCQKLAFAERKS